MVGYEIIHVVAYACWRGTKSSREGRQHAESRHNTVQSDRTGIWDVLTVVIHYKTT